MTKEEALKIDPPVIKRNGIDLKLTTAVYSPKAEDSLKGKVFFTAELEQPKLDYITEQVDGKDVKVPILRDVESFLWAGLDQIVGATNKVLRGVFGVMCKENYIENNGVFDMESFLEEAPDFTAARESLANIQEELDDLTALQSNYALDDVFVEAMSTGVFPPAAIEIQKKVREIAQKVRTLKGKKEQITAIYTARAATRKENEAKKQAAAAAKKAQAEGHHGHAVPA